MSTYYKYQSSIPIIARSIYDGSSVKLCPVLHGRRQSRLVNKASTNGTEHPVQTDMGHDKRTYPVYVDESI